MFFVINIDVYKSNNKTLIELTPAIYLNNNIKYSREVSRNRSERKMNSTSEKVDFSQISDEQLPVAKHELKGWKHFMGLF